MTEAHHRKKQPVLVRKQLLEVAARLASEKGMNSVTLDAVSGASGISKGGLLHHFPSKSSLMEALFDSLLEKLDRDIDAEMRSDPVSHGRFTRAYLRAVVRLRERPAEARDWAHVTAALIAEPSLRDRWKQWVRQRNEEYIGTDSSIDAQIVRLAADGLWLGDILGSHDGDETARRVLFDRLIGLAGK